MNAFFVTATGTDIGKTYVTAGLVRRLRAAVVKPVISGFDRTRAAESDAGVLLAAMGRTVTDDAVASISPWRFTAPLSPDMAAAREGRTVDFDALVQFSRDAMERADGALFIEGAGGVMTPLTARHTMLDWIAALGAPAILVTGSYLGTISHTLTALDALARRNVCVAALVVSESEGSPVPLDETDESLARFLPGIPRAILHCPAHDAEFTALARVLQASVTARR